MSYRTNLIPWETLFQLLEEKLQSCDPVVQRIAVDRLMAQLGGRATAGSARP